MFFSIAWRNAKLKPQRKSNILSHYGNSHSHVLYCAFSWRAGRDAFFELNLKATLWIAF